MKGGREGVHSNLFSQPTYTNSSDHSNVDIFPYLSIYLFALLLETFTSFVLQLIDIK